jgi:hypothetical protein
MLRARREEDFVTAVETDDAGTLRNAAGLRAVLVSRGAAD